MADETDVVVDEEQDVPVEETTEEAFVLSERELAIARGKDPDEAQAEEPEEDSPVEEEPEGQADREVADGTEAAAPSWEPQDIELAESYGLGAEERDKLFGTPEEFRSWAARTESILSSKRAPAVSDNLSTTEPEKEPEKEPEPEPEKKPGRLNRQEFIEAGYGEKELALVDQINQQQDLIEKLEKQSSEVSPFLQQWQAEYQQQQAFQLESQFDQAVDQFSESRYGRRFKEGTRGLLDDSHYENRRKLFDAMSHVYHENISAGLQPPSLGVLLQKAEFRAFGEEIVKERQAQHQEKVAAQAKRIRPAGNRPVRRTKPAPPASNGEQEPDELARQIAENPEVKALWDSFQEDNGEK